MQTINLLYEYLTMIKPHIRVHLVWLTIGLHTSYTSAFIPFTRPKKMGIVLLVILTKRATNY